VVQSPKTNANYLQHLIDQGHESVLEHAVYSVVADGISRGLSHQLVRHRAGFSYSQLSQQYHDETNAEFAAPLGLGHSSNAHRVWRSAVNNAKDAYAVLMGDIARSKYASHLSRKERLRAIRSLARGVLPNATVTTLVITGNARAWRHLLKIRGAISGDPEMRTFCAQLFNLLRRETPDLFRGFEIKRDRLGPFVRYLG
jgi:thymidylate synthase (FAD)